MTLLLSAPDFTWPLMEHDHVLSHVSRLQLDGIDIGLFQERSHIQPSDVLDDAERHAAGLAERLGGYGLSLSDVFLVPSAELETLAVNHPDAAVRAESYRIFRAIVDFARLAGATGMTINPGVEFAGEELSGSLRRSAEELSRRVEVAGSLGVEVSIEGGLGTNTLTPEALLELVDLTPGLKVTLDYTHFVYQGMDEGRIEPLLDHTRHFHCRGGAPGRMQTTFDENVIDYGRIADGLEARGFGGYVAIEYVWIDVWDCFRTENTMETIRFRDFFRGRSGTGA